MTSYEIAEQMAYDRLLAEDAQRPRGESALVRPGDPVPTPAEVTRRLLDWRATRSR